MSPARKLDPVEISAKLESLPDWSEKDGKLRRELSFPDFGSAFGFMTEVALFAEATGHHPEWYNVYNRVTVDLSTHDVGGISDLDFAMADKIDAVARRFR